jgi:hypothetical protein
VDAVRSSGEIKVVSERLMSARNRVRRRDEGTMDKINLAEKLTRFDEHWEPDVS